MNNDLISREALKKHKVYSLERHEYVVPVYNIDNAPTVEQPKDRYQVIFLKPLTEREKEALKEALGNCQYVLIEGEEE